MNFKKTILDTLFPIFCLTCQKEGSWICLECQTKVELLFPQICPYCEKEVSKNGLACESCQRNKIISLDALITATTYDKIAKLIHLYKYNFAFDLRLFLGKIILRAYLKNNLPLPDFIVPVPLYPSRLRWRGFNQSALLGQYLSENLTVGMKIPLLDQNLIRQKYTSPQMKIKNYQERKRNLVGAFRVKNKEIFQNKTVLIVDDVATTGATLFECAKVLKESGAKKVFGIVVARQAYTNKRKG